MKKLKIYLETSTISYLDQPERGERSADSHRLWEKLKAGRYEAVISNVAIQEIRRCEEDKRKILLNYLSEIEYAFIEINERGIEIAGKFIDLGVLRRQSLNDCRHIAAAITSGCDVIVSWNFRHIVNHKTMMGVKAVTALEGYDDLLIYTPSTLIGGEEDDTQHTDA